MSFIVESAKRFFILQWKHHLSQWTKRTELTWIIFSPVAICLIAVFLRLDFTARSRLDHVFDEIDLDKSWQQMTSKLRDRKTLALAKNPSFKHNIFIPQLIVAYAPNTYINLEMMMRTALEQLPGMKLINFENCDILEEKMRKEHYFAGVCFDTSEYESDNGTDDPPELSQDQMPKHLNYSLIFPSELRSYEDSYIGAHWKTNTIIDRIEYISKRLNQSGTGGYVGYVREGFAKLQKAISETYIKMLPNYLGDMPDVRLRRFPVRDYNFDPIIHFLTCCLALMLVIGFMFSAQVMVMKMVIEKNGNLIVSMRNMRIGRFMYFTAWIFRFVTYSFVSCILVTIILKVNWNDKSEVVANTSWSMVFMILMSYCICSAAFTTIFGTIFATPQTAVKALSMTWVFTYLPYCAWLTDMHKGYRIRYLIFALPNSLLALSFQLFFESEQISMNDFSYIKQSNNVSEPVTLNECLMYFYIMTLVFGCISVYVSIMIDSDFKSAKRLLRPSTRDSLVEHTVNTMPDVRQHWVSATKIFEVDPSYKTNKIKIMQLGKRYPNSNRFALINLTMNLHQNEVTVLMGHNGAGKTTLLALLAGFTGPTRGTAIIEGHDMVTRRFHASQHIGAALDKSMLVPELSVGNNIRFACFVKGVKWRDINEEIQYYASALNLDTKLNMIVKNLTVTDRGLLMICCAFCGGSTVILIDDVHADMDTASLNLVWDLIRREKRNRTVLLVSSSTAPTERLADRIAIISNGELKCTGTKSFLRSMYGHGYRLTCIRGTYCKADELMKFLTQYIPNLIIEADIGNRITFILETKYEDKFDELLDSLERQLRQLDVVSITLRETSIEEIFIQMGIDSGHTGSINYTLMQQPLMIKEYMGLCDSLKNKNLRGRHLLLQHIQSMLFKHWIWFRRKLSIVIINVLMLLLTILLSFLTITVKHIPEKLQPMSYNLTKVGYLHSVVETVGKNIMMQELYEHYTEILYWYDANLREIFTEEGKDLYMLQKTSFATNLNYKYLFGASFSDGRVTSWFNNIPLHTVPYSLNAVHNALARMYMEDEVSIDVRLQPLPFETQPNHFQDLPIGFASLLAVNLSICLSFVWTGPSWYLINERVSGFKRLQLQAGARISAFWISTFLMDLIQITLISIWILVITTYFLCAFEDISVYGWFFISCILSGLATTSITYVATRAIDNPALGYIFMAFYNVVSVVLFLTIQTIMHKTMANFPDVLQFMTQYTFAEIVHKIFIIYELKMFCNDEQIRFMSEVVEGCRTEPDCCNKQEYWSSDFGIEFEFMCLFMAFLLAWIVLLCLEFREYSNSLFLQRQIPKRNKNMEFSDHILRHTKGPFRIDESVISERTLVRNLTCEDRKFYALVCDTLGKVKRNTTLINRVDLAISRGECLSLMDLSNYSTSTLIQMLAGNIRPSYGRIYIRGYNMETQHAKCLKMIGHCPAYIDLPLSFTPKELLLLSAKLHGIPKSKVHSVCRLLAHILGFFSVYTKPVSMCSFGNMRRLTLALAMIGDPHVTLIEGVPCGLDPGGKRSVFNIISMAREYGKSFVFTSLTSSESERAADRVAVLLNGHVLTIGPMVEMYGKRVQCYLLEVKMKRPASISMYMRRELTLNSQDAQMRMPVTPQMKFIQFMELHFPDAVLRDENDFVIIFQIPLKSTRLSTIFDVLRRNSFILNIEDFFLSRNTLTAIYAEMIQEAKSATGHYFSKRSTK